MESVDKTYLKYIPSIVSNHTVNAVILTFIPGILYVLAAYGQLFIANISLGVRILISIFFAACEYLVRVPIISYSQAEAGMSNGTMQFVWIVVTFILSKGSDYLYPKG